MVILITMKKDEKTGYYINEVNGRKYAYIQKSHVWNKEKKQAETSLEYVGKIDDEGKRSRLRRRSSMSARSMMKGISSQRRSTW